MLTEYDVTKFATYQWGVEKGIEQGKKIGEEKGQLRLVRQLLQQGLLNEEGAAQTLGMTVDKLKEALNKS